MSLSAPSPVSEAHESHAKPPLPPLSQSPSPSSMHANVMHANVMHANAPPLSSHPASLSPPVSSTIHATTDSSKSGVASPVSGRKMPRLQAVVRRIGSTIATTIGTGQIKNRTKREKDFLKAYLKKFDADEVEVLRKVYKELSCRSPGPGIDKATFLQYFPLPGLWGERLFQRFDYKCIGYVDYEEFLVGMAVCCRGTKCERIHVLFQVFDLNGDGVLQRQELVAMLSNLPNLDRYLQKDQAAKRQNGSSSSEQTLQHQGTIKSPCFSSAEHTPPHSPTQIIDLASIKLGGDPTPKQGDHVDFASSCTAAALHMQHLPTNLEVQSDLDRSSILSQSVPDVHSLAASLCDSTLQAEASKTRTDVSCIDDELFRMGYREDLDFDSDRDSVGNSSDEDFDDESLDDVLSEELLDKSEATVAVVETENEMKYAARISVADSAHHSDFIPKPMNDMMISGASTPAGRRDSVLSSTGSTHDSAMEQRTRSAIDVDAFVDKIIEECEFSDSDSLNFMEFKTWLEKNDAILSMFTDCLHEEAWGLQGNALYRGTSGPGGRTGRRQRRFNISNRHVGTEEGSKRGVVEIRPDGFYKVRRLFTLPITGSLLSTFGNQPPQPSLFSFPSHSSIRGPPTSSASRPTNSPPSPKLIEVDEPDISKPDLSEATSEAPVPDVEIYPRQTRDVLTHQLMDLIVASNPGVDVNSLGGGWLPQEDILACPACRSLLVVCPKCHRRCPNIRLSNGGVVIECKRCLEGTPHEFNSCWHCNWSFAEAPEWVDQCEPLHEGILYKIGRHTHKWRQRYFVLVDNLLYYYSRKDDTKPKGFFFLEGCFVEPIISKSGDVSVSADGESKPHAQPSTATASLIKFTGAAASSSSGNKYGFSILHGGGKVPRRDLYASSDDQREAWMAALRTAMNQQAIEQTYKLAEVVGQGKFSAVHLGFTRDTNQEVAIKVIDKGKITGNERELLRSEIAILRLLRHPHVISFREVLDSQKNIYIVMEYVKGGELYDLLQQKRRLKELHVNRIIFQLLSTVAYLHKCGIIHRDLKPENILLTDKTIDADIKITDFGLSCICGMDELVTQPCGTLAYVAPEVLTLEGYNHKVDVWSVGVIMFLLLRGRLPFPVGRVSNATRSACSYRTLSFEGPVWDNVCSSAKDLLKKMLQVNPAKRISAQAALQHIWIKNPTAVISEGVEDAEAAPAPPHSGNSATDATNTTETMHPSEASPQANSLPAVLDVSASTFCVPQPLVPTVSASPPPSVVSHIQGAQIPSTVSTVQAPPPLP